jgi:hypothetical protein
MRAQGPVAEHRHRSREPPCLPGQARQPEPHRARDGVRRYSFDNTDRRRGRRDAVARQRAQQLAQEQRVAAGRMVAGETERLLGFRAELSAHQFGNRTHSQRVRPLDRRRRVDQ